MSTVVEEGERLLAAEAARVQAEREAQAQEELEAQALAELRLSAGAILGLLSTVVARLDTLEKQVANTEQMVMCTRIRRPVRDELGTILYVVDEMNPPIWAQPLADGPAEEAKEY